MTTDSPTRPDTLPRMPAIDLSLPIEGMTCASCSNRVQRFLSKTDGVLDATVNLATERAQVRFDPAVVGRDELVRAVEDAGYGVRAEVVAPNEGLEAAAAADAERRALETRRLGWEAAVALIVGVAMMAASLLLTPLIPPRATESPVSDPGHARAVRPWLAFLRRGRPRRPPPQREHEHTRCPWHFRCVALLDRGDSCAGPRLGGR